MKILFLIKGDCGYGYGGPKSGLIESAKLTAARLHEFFGIEVKVTICVDGNSVDKVVHDFKPDKCIIEALWVTPEKMLEVAQLHPKVDFYVRVHSEISFLANEGIAVEWLKAYEQIPHVEVSFNSCVANEDFEDVAEYPPVYLPNLYTDVRPKHSIFNLLKHKKTDDVVNIGCFGAIRPLKNQLMQAFAAMEYGNANGKTVFFHINAGRTEQGGDSVLKNMRWLFDGTKHSLVEHKWLPRSEFLNLISLMDIGLQVSFTESFNIVTADFVAQGVPIVVSEAVRWMPNSLKVPNDIYTLSEKIKEALKFSTYYENLAKQYLHDYNSKSLKAWRKIL